jgi:site-specific recombinase XerC
MRYRGLEREQARSLIEAAGVFSLRHRAVCALLYFASLRCSEAAGLRTSADLGNWLSIVGKGAQSRMVPIHPDLRAALDAAGPPKGEAYYFPGRRPGTHISPATVNQYVRVAAAAAGLGHVTPHQLRYTSGAAMLDRFGDLRAVGEYLGHSRSSLSITAGYTRTTDAKMFEMTTAL